MFQRPAGFAPLVHSDSPPAQLPTKNEQNETSSAKSSKFRQKNTLNVPTNSQATQHPAFLL